MQTINKNSGTISSTEEIQTQTTQPNNELNVTGQESLLFKMYDLEEEDLFV